MHLLKESYTMISLPSLFTKKKKKRHLLWSDAQFEVDKLFSWNQEGSLPSASSSLSN